MIGLFDNTTHEDINHDPWTHIVKKDVLPADLYNQLSSDFPEELILSKGEQMEPGKFRLCLANIAKGSISETWYNFMQYHVSSYFVDQYVKLFPSETLQRGIDTYKKLKATNYGLRYSNDIRSVNIDCQFILETPHNYTEYHSRSPHYDRSNKVCDMLFYMKKERDDSIGRDFLMFEHTPETQYSDGHVTNLDTLTLGKTVAYDSNTFVLIPMRPGTAVHCADKFEHESPTDDHRRRYFELLIEA